jgi:hypothetical protein
MARGIGEIEGEIREGGHQLSVQHITLGTYPGTYHLLLNALNFFTSYFSVLLCLQFTMILAKYIFYLTVLSELTLNDNLHS